MLCIFFRKISSYVIQPSDCHFSFLSSIENTLTIQHVLSNYRLSRAIKPAVTAPKAKPKYRNLLGVIQSSDISQIKHCYYNCSNRQEQKKKVIKLESVSGGSPTNLVIQREHLHIKCKSRFHTEEMEDYPFAHSSSFSSTQ